MENIKRCYTPDEVMFYPNLVPNKELATVVYLNALLLFNKKKLNEGLSVIVSQREREDSNELLDYLDFERAKELLEKSGWKVSLTNVISGVQGHVTTLSINKEE